MTGVFADNAVITMSGDISSQSGWINKNVVFLKLLINKYFNKKIFSPKYIQVCYQLLSVVVAVAWSFVLTYLILQLIGLVPFLHLRLTKEEEEM